MRNSRFGLLICCALAATLGCRAPSPNWNGTWKLEPSSSSYQGPVFIISISPDGDYHYDDGNSSFTLRCDGKDRSIGNKRTRVCTRSGSTLIDITQAENGVKTRAAHWELSSDRNSFSSTVTTFRSSGPAITAKTVFSRLSGSNDFASRWRDMTYLRQHAEMTLRLDNEALHIDYPSAGQYIDVPLGGVDAVGTWSSRGNDLRSTHGCTPRVSHPCEAQRQSVHERLS